MRDYFAEPMTGGQDIAQVSGDGPAHRLTIGPEGAVIEQVWPRVVDGELDKHDYKVYVTEGGTGKLYRAGL